MLRVLFAAHLGSINEVSMNKVLGSVSICFMHSLRSVEEHMRNVNEKKYLKCVGNVTDVFQAHFTERLARVRRARMNIQNP